MFYYDVYRRRVVPAPTPLAYWLPDWMRAGVIQAGHHYARAFTRWLDLHDLDSDERVREPVLPRVWLGEE